MINIEMAIFMANAKFDDCPTISITACGNGTFDNQRCEDYPDIIFDKNCSVYEIEKTAEQMVKFYKIILEDSNTGLKALIVANSKEEDEILSRVFVNTDRILLCIEHITNDINRLEVRKHD
jgi:hypothetical protein